MSTSLLTAPRPTGPLQRAVAPGKTAAQEQGAGGEEPVLSVGGETGATEAPAVLEDEGEGVVASYYVGPLND